MPRPLSAGSVAVMSLLVLIALIAPLEGRADPPADILQELDRAVSLRKEGHVLKAYQALKGALASLDSEDLGPVNDHLQGAGAPAIESILMELRGQSVLSPDWKKVRSTNGLESQMLVRALYGALGRRLDDIDANLAQTQAAPTTDPMGTKNALQRSVAAAGQFDSIRRQYDDLIAIARGLSKSERNALGSELADAVDNRFADLGRRIHQTQQQSEHLLVELRFAELQSALDHPLERDASLPERLEYVTSIASSIEAIYTLTDELSAAKKVSKRSVSRLIERLAPLERKFHATYLEERRIAYDLEAGTRWWIRGRYGKGLARMGLLKELPQGVSTTRANLLTQPLLMPEPLPEDHDVAATFDDSQPVACYIQAIHPTVTRRHYVIWGTFIYGAIGDEGIYYFIREPPTGRLDYAFFADQAPAIGGSIQTGTDADRIVGFIEYQMALAHFNRMLKSLDDEERDDIDLWVAKDPRLKFFSCVSRLYDPISGNSSLRDPFHAQDGGFVRTGLRWIMALARVELDAMRVGIESLEDTQTASPGPAEKSSFDSLEYREILWDAARTHYYSLRYYVPSHKREGTFKEGELFKGIGKRYYPLLAQEYAVAGDLCKRLRELLIRDRQSNPRMIAELDDWIQYLEDGEIIVNSQIEERVSKYSTKPQRIKRTYGGKIGNSPSTVKVPTP